MTEIGKPITEGLQFSIYIARTTSMSMIFLINGKPDERTILLTDCIHKFVHRKFYFFTECSCSFSFQSSDV